MADARRGATRPVPESRIKRLETYVLRDEDPADAAEVDRRIAEMAGIEIAKQLLQFKKVEQRTLGGVAVWVFSVDVIVPDSKP